MRSVAEVCASAQARPPAKELYLRIPMMNNEQGINLGQVRGLVCHGKAST